MHQSTNTRKCTKNKYTLQNQYGTEPGKRTMGGAVAPGVFVILPNEEGRSVRGKWVTSIKNLQILVKY